MIMEAPHPAGKGSAGMIMEAPHPAGKGNAGMIMEAPHPAAGEISRLRWRRRCSRPRLEWARVRHFI